MLVSKKTTNRRKQDKIFLKVFSESKLRLAMMLGMAFGLQTIALNFHSYHFNPFPNKQILDSFKLKEFAEDNFKFNENDRKFSKQVENSVGKEEIARKEQFLLFPQSFQKTCSSDT